MLHDLLSNFQWYRFLPIIVSFSFQRILLLHLVIFEEVLFLWRIQFSFSNSSSVCACYKKSSIHCNKLSILPWNASLVWSWNQIAESDPPWSIRNGVNITRLVRIDIISWDLTDSGIFQKLWQKSMLAYLLLFAQFCNDDSKCGRLHFILSVLAFTPWRSTVNLSYSVPGLGTARAGLAHLAWEFLTTAPIFSRFLQ